MTALFESNANAPATDRRSCGRQRVLFSSVVLSENNCGRVLNISPRGLALQTDTELVGEEFPFRFKFSPSLAWVQAKGRVAWRNDSKNVVGIEFTGLTDEVQRQIQTWMDWKKELNNPSGNGTAAAESTGNERLGLRDPTETVENLTNGEGVSGPSPRVPIASSDAVDLNPQSQNLQTAAEVSESETLFPPESVEQPGNQARLSQSAYVREQLETNDFGEGSEHTVESSKRLNVVVLVLVLVLGFWVVLIRHHYSQKASNGPQTPLPVAQATVPAANLSATTTASKAAPPAVNPPTPSVPSTSRKPGPQGRAFVVQAGAMVDQENANALAASLRELSFPAFVIKLPTDRFHYVFVGPYDSKSSAIETQNQLEEKGYKCFQREWKMPSR
jgi:cell division protein FtsN